MERHYARSLCLYCVTQGRCVKVDVDREIKRNLALVLLV